MVLSKESNADPNEPMAVWESSSLAQVGPSALVDYLPWSEMWQKEVESILFIAGMLIRK